MSRFCITGAAVLVAASLAQPSPVDAQGGLMRRLKDRAEETITSVAGPSAESAAPASAPAGSRPSGSSTGSVPRITSELLVRLQNGLQAEEADRAEVIKLLASSDQYDQCAAAAGSSPEAMQLLMEFAPRFETADAQKVMEEYGAALTSMLAQRCGPSPTDAQELRRRPAKVGREAAELDEREYALLKERALPFCRNAETAGQQVPGQGRNIFFVYGESEIEALRPRCGDLLPLLQVEA